MAVASPRWWFLLRWYSWQHSLSAHALRMIGTLWSLRWVLHNIITSPYQPRAVHSSLSVVLVVLRMLEIHIVLGLHWWLHSPLSTTCLHLIASSIIILQWLVVILSAVIGLGTTAGLPTINHLSCGTTVTLYVTTKVLEQRQLRVWSISCAILALLFDNVPQRLRFIVSTTHAA